MRKKLANIYFLGRSKKIFKEIDHLLKQKEKNDFTFIFETSLKNIAKSKLHFDLVIVYYGNDEGYFDKICKSIEDDNFPRYYPVLFLGNFLKQDCFERIKNKSVLLDFLPFPTTSEYFNFKLNQIIGLNNQILSTTAFDLKNEVENPSKSLEHLSSKEISNPILNKMLSERTKQLVKEINSNIQSRIKSDGIFLNSNSSSSNDLINSLLETTPNPIYYKNDRGIYLGCNKAFEKHLGMGKNDILGKSVFDFFIPEFAEKITSQDRKVFRNNAPGYNEETAILNDGSQKDVAIYRNIFTIDEHTLSKGLIGIIIDISHQRKAKKLVQIQHDIDIYSWAQGGLEKSLQYILKKLTEIEWVDSGGIYLFGEGKKDLIMISNIGLSAKFIVENQVFDEDSPQVKFVKRNKIFYGNYNELIKITKRIENKEGLKAIAVLPLIRENEVIGSINLASKTTEDIPGNDKIAIESIAAKIAIVVGYLKIREDVEKAKLHLEAKVKLRTKELDKVNTRLLSEIEFHKSTKASLYYSENLYRGIFNNAQDGIVLYDAETLAVVDFNPRTYLDLGYTRKEFAELKTEDFTIYESNIQRQIIFKQLFRDKKVVYEVKHKTKSNRIKHRIISANLIEIHTKKFILGIVHDVTRLYLAKFELKQKDEKIKALQENVSIGLFRINRKGVISYANSYVANIFGDISKDNIIRTNILDYITDGDTLKDLIAQLDKKGEVNNFELKIKRRDDAVIWTNISVKVVPNEMNIIIYYDGYIEDITELKIIQLKLEIANNKIRTINKNLNRRIDKAVSQEKRQQTYIVQKSKLESLGELSAGIAHEINQPLGIMSLTFENLQSRLLSGEFTDKYVSGKISSISSNIDRIRDIIDHIRIFSRDRESIVMEKVDVNIVISDIYKLIKTQYQNNNIKVTFDLKDNMGFTIGSKLKLEQVLLNLLSNAKYATEERDNLGDEMDYEKTIKIKTSITKSRICLSVEDNGVGIDPEIIEKLFDPFFTTKPEWVGTGLGLSIVYGIIKEMKGEIKVKSKIGASTIFQIFLPRFPEKE